MRGLLTKRDRVSRYLPAGDGQLLAMMQTNQPKSFQSKFGLLETTITVGTLKRVKALKGYDLLKVVDEPELLNKLADDPAEMVDVIYCVVKPQLDAKGVTDEQFGESLDGDSVEAATKAFLEGLVDFFPGARRAMLRRVLERSSEMAEQSETKIRELLSDGTIDRAIDQALNPSTAGAS